MVRPPVNDEGTCEAQNQESFWSPWQPDGHCDCSNPKSAVGRQNFQRRKF